MSTSNSDRSPQPAPGGPDQSDLNQTGQESSSQDQGALELELERVQAELQDANERALRAQAELDNFRKRIRREMEDDRRYASANLIRDLLSILDNLHRAIDAADQSQNTAGLLEGVKMVAQQFHLILEQHHCRKIEALGQPFDPNLHEAVSQEPSSEYPAGTVSRVVRVGYQLHDRVVRPSQVFVSLGDLSASNEGAPSADGKNATQSPADSADPTQQ